MTNDEMRVLLEEAEMKLKLTTVGYLGHSPAWQNNQTTNWWQALDRMHRVHDALAAPTPTPPQADEWSRFLALCNAAVPSPLGAAAIRPRDISTPADALAAINTMQAGDSIRLAAGMTIPGRVILPALAFPGEVLCNGAKFTGVDISTGRWDTIFAGHSANVRMYDGEVAASANTGIRLYGDCPNVGFYRFKVGGTNGSGLLWNPIYGDLVDCDFVGEITQCGKQFYVDQYDPHAEKGTGVHGFYLGGATGGRIRGARILAHIHDQHYGAGVELNLIDKSTRPSQISAYAERLTFVAKQQVAGNVIQAWGDNGPCEFPLLYGEDLQGRVMDTNTPTPDLAYTGFRVARARALRTNLNAALASTEGNVALAEPFDSRRGVAYADKAKLA